MLVSFSVRNFRTFREKAIWSMVASADTEREEENVVVLPEFGLRLLKSAVVYGANASGKTKLIEAMTFFRDFVRDSSKESQAGEDIEVEPFRLNPATAIAPSEFEIVFTDNTSLYRYGFEVSEKRVEAEWLFLRVAKNSKSVRMPQEQELFYRAQQEISHHSKLFGGIVNELIKNRSVRTNALLLSVAAQFNHPRAIEVQGWVSNMGFISGLNDTGYRGYTISQLANPARKKAILSLLGSADLDIEDLHEAKMPEIEAPSDMPKELIEELRRDFADVRTIHRAYTDTRQPAPVVALSLRRNASAGTQKFLALTGPLLDVTDEGMVLIVDELDARLHPNLVCKIVQLFNSKNSNPHNAQLLFNTQDTNLLSEGGFRRDQIWFTEKDRYGEATLYSLADFKTDKVRKGDNYERNYVQGKYGAVPYLGDFTSLPSVNAKPIATPTDEDEG